MKITKKCYVCDGKGYTTRSYNKGIIQESCSYCKGKGKVSLSDKEKDELIKNLIKRLDLIVNRLNKLEDTNTEREKK